MGLLDFFKKSNQRKKEKTASDVQDTSSVSKEDAFNKILDFLMKQSPSHQFASGSVFDISRRSRDVFLQALHSNDAGKLFLLFANAYSLFLDHPEVVGFTPDMVNKDNNDTDPRTWNADIINLQSGDIAALCFMPIQNDTLTARIIGIVFSDNGDGYYYCMLNKDEDVPSEVFRNKAILGIEKVGEVNGRGFDLMNNFMGCIKHNFYKN